MTHSDETIFTEVPHWCTINIYHSEDWYDAVPQMVAPGTDEPIDLSAYPSLVFDLFIRPVYDHATVIAHLTSTGSAGILIEDAASGMIAIHRTQAVVDTWPLGEWEQWLNMSWTDTDLGAVVKTIWRGPMRIHPGRLDA